MFAFFYVHGFFLCVPAVYAASRKPKFYTEFALSSSSRHRFFDPFFTWFSSPVFHVLLACYVLHFVGLLLYVMRTMYMKSSQQALMFANEKGLLYSFACHEVSVKFRQKILFIELAPRAIISLLTKNTRFVAHKMGIKARGTFKFILFM